MMRKRFWFVLGVAACMSVGCGSPPASSSNPKAPLVTWNVAKREVQWKVIAGDGRQNGGMNFDGYADGDMTLVVPMGWRVVIEFENASLMPHSAMVVPYDVRARASFDASILAFPGAETPNPSQGEPKGSRNEIVFTASRVGTYALVCGVPGHALAGMWDRLVVSDQAKQPSLDLQRGS
ncbi:hypothetical protein IW967_14845 [Alicyclobacillus mali]|uniref:Sulfocyanin-like C-terminal domain-containing protein n=2 Tax=Alicyclobacillus mali (ex Roth et al. 2021) TaxID=1123961 RepID=A0ABS0F7A0_9BACL|nr:hypothetical protein [Alicyclobacillus mali (ex Roth et al. 2021)]MCL6489167.1 hypothetical protein [Alicyclobacillus mali (ex Roth et al. 2021)]